jgi:hypothetical protein
MTSLKKLAVLAAAWLPAGCVVSPFDTSWRDPDATPLHVEGAKVAAIAMMESESERRAAEDALVRELDALGAEGVAMYTIVAGAAPGDETEARAALDGMGFAGAVVLRPVARTTELVSEPVFVGPDYFSLWDGYYRYGWNEPWRVAVVNDLRIRELVSIEVLVYSLRQNRLVWGGQTTTTDSASVARLVGTTARSVAKELERQELLSVGQASPGRKQASLEEVRP